VSGDSVGAGSTASDDRASTDLTERDKLIYSSVTDTSKQILTLASAIFALTITFAKTLPGGE